MIEVEKKFKLNPGDEERLIKGANFLGEVTNDDAYYDTSDYKLTGNDHWLRLRNGQWELKYSRNHEKAIGDRVVDRYEELETEQEIAERLNLPKDMSLKEVLEKAGYSPVIKYSTTRKQYQSGEFHIDIDEADFDFEIAEIELMAEDDAGAEAAGVRIVEFAKSKGLEAGDIRGKAIEYLVRFSPEHYQVLKDAGVCK